jgi:hypothetical protein
VEEVVVRKRLRDRRRTRVLIKSMKEKAAYIHGSQGVGRDAS